MRLGLKDLRSRFSEACHDSICRWHIYCHSNYCNRRGCSNCGRRALPPLILKESCRMWFAKASWNSNTMLNRSAFVFKTFTSLNNMQMIVLKAPYIIKYCYLTMNSQCMHLFKKSYLYPQYNTEAQKLKWLHINRWVKLLSFMNPNFPIMFPQWTNIFFEVSALLLSATQNMTQ